MSYHFGHGKHDTVGLNLSNLRKGSRLKAVLTPGPLEIKNPRDRVGTLESKTIRKHSRQMPGVDELTTTASAKGLKTGDITGMLRRTNREGCGRRRSARGCASVMAEMADWQDRPLDASRRCDVQCWRASVKIGGGLVRELAGILPDRRHPARESDTLGL